MGSKIIRIALIIICSIGIVFIAVLCFQDEHRIDIMRSKAKVDFASLDTYTKLLEAGKKVFDKALVAEVTDESNEKKLMNFYKAGLYFDEIMRRDEMTPEAYAYRGAIKGMMANYETDTMIKLNLVKEGLASLDTALDSNKDLGFAYFYRGIFSIEIPDNIFKRLDSGISDLERALDIQKRDPFLDNEEYYYILFYLGQGKLLKQDPEGEKILKQVVEESGIPALAKKAQFLLE